MRYVTQCARDDPAKRRRTGRDRIRRPIVRLVELIQAMGISARQLLREKGTPYAELGLADPKWSDDELIDLMLAHPILINRPIVETPKGVRLCRPSELVLDLLPGCGIGPFVKEDGESVIDAEGRRVV